MNIYIETNFVLELVFHQEEQEYCNTILSLCEQNLAQLIIPAYSLVEPHEKLIRQAKSRKELQQSLNTELRQLTRTATYATRVNSIQDIARLLIQSNEEEAQRFVAYRDRMLRVSDVISLTTDVIAEAATFEVPLDLSPQDAIIYATVLTHLRTKLQQPSCFINRNKRDFDNPDIVAELTKHNCKLFGNFGQGLQYIQSQIAR